MNIEPEGARRETNDQEERFARFGDHLPHETDIARTLQLVRLYHSPAIWGLSVTSHA